MNELVSLRETPHAPPPTPHIQDKLPWIPALMVSGCDGAMISIRHPNINVPIRVDIVPGIAKKTLTLKFGKHSLKREIKYEQEAAGVALAMLFVLSSYPIGMRRYQKDVRWRIEELPGNRGLQLVAKKDGITLTRPVLVEVYDEWRVTLLLYRGGQRHYLVFTGEGVETMYHALRYIIGAAQ